MNVTTTTTPESAQTASNAPANLEIENLSVRFAGVRALSGVTLRHSTGGVLGLIGPNGAGKTTALNVLSGAVRPSSGEVRLDGVRISGRRPDRIARAGVTRTFQNLQTFGSLTALENVLVPLEARAASRPVVGPLIPLLHAHQLRDGAAELLVRVGLEDHLHTPVAALPYGAQRRVEVARALAGNPRLLLLDEPMAGLSRVESDELAEVIRAVADDGVTVLLVEHDVVAVMRISDRVVVLHHGELIADGTPEQVQADERVRTAYLGEELQTDLHRAADEPDAGTADTLSGADLGPGDEGSGDAAVDQDTAVYQDAAVDREPDDAYQNADKSDHPAEAR